MSELKKRLLENLKDEIAKADAKEEALNKEIRMEMLIHSAIAGGILAKEARHVCERRADAAREKLKTVELESAWKRETLAKYKDKSE